MKTIIRIIAGLFLLAVMYFVVADGMMTHFGYSRAIQYAFNMFALIALMPLGLYFLLDLGGQSHE
jgi:hypothetical protein